MEAVVAFLVRRLLLVGQAQNELLSDLGGRDEVVVQCRLLTVLFLHTILSTITNVSKSPCSLNSELKCNDKL